MSCSTRSSTSACAEPWRLTEPLVAAGIDSAWLDRLDADRRAGASAAVAWIAASLTARGLAAEIAESTDRMGKLVKAIKAYAFMDRGELVETDIHEGLETTLVVLGHKLKHTSIEVRRDYDRSLPKLTLRGSELNQVWTNLLANAIEALGETGTIEIVTERDGACARVDIIDDGPGIPDDDPRSRVRPVLHHQGRRRGHRPRPRHRTPDRHRAARRLDRVRLRARANRVPRLAAARRRGHATEGLTDYTGVSERSSDWLTNVSTSVPWRSTKAGPTPLIAASSATERGRSVAIDSSVLLCATVNAGLPSLARTRHSRSVSSSPRSPGSSGLASGARRRLDRTGVNDAGSGNPIVSGSQTSQQRPCGAPRRLSPK